MRKRMMTLCLAVILLFSAEVEPLYAMGNVQKAAALENDAGAGVSGNETGVPGNGETGEGSGNTENEGNDEGSGNTGNEGNDEGSGNTGNEGNENTGNEGNGGNTGGEIENPGAGGDTGNEGNEGNEGDTGGETENPGTGGDEGEGGNPGEAGDGGDEDQEKAEYTVIFDFAGGTVTGIPGTSTEIKVKEGETIISQEIPAPVKTGYKFQCWVNEAGQQYDLNAPSPFGLI